MIRSHYLAALHDDATSLIDTARRHAGSQAPAVPYCPGWLVTDLVLHLGAVHRHAVKIVGNHEREQVPISPDDLGWLELPQPYLHWLLSEQSPPGEPLPIGILTWFEEGANKVEKVVYAADPDEPVWSWSPDKRAAHYQRMLAIETAIHRRDVQQAYGHPEPIDADLARDGIDHTFAVLLPARREWATPRAGAGESYRFQRTDGEGAWTVLFNPGGVAVTRGHGGGDVTVSGLASDLFLFLWGRVPAQALAVSGDAALLDRYFELVPPR